MPEALPHILHLDHASLVSFIKPSAIQPFHQRRASSTQTGPNRIGGLPLRSLMISIISVEPTGGAEWKVNRQPEGWISLTTPPATATELLDRRSGQRAALDGHKHGADAGAALDRDHIQRSTAIAFSVNLQDTALQEVGVGLAILRKQANLAFSLGLLGDRFSGCIDGLAIIAAGTKAT